MRAMRRAMQDSHYENCKSKTRGIRRKRARPFTADYVFLRIHRI